MLRNLSFWIGLHRHWRIFSLPYTHPKPYLMCIDRSKSEAGAMINKMTPFLLFPHFSILLTKHTWPWRWPKHLRYQHGTGRDNTKPCESRHFSEAAFDSITQDIAQCPHCFQAVEFREPHPIFAQRKAEISCSIKMVPIPQQQIFVYINSEMCSKGAWDRSKGFAFIRRSWLALNLSKTPIVVNGE